jgi:DNA segregation ATPase FtsK/SpoIIIE, S-DNA-T family
VTTVLALVLVLAALVLAGRAAWAVWRFCRLSPAARANYLPMWRARLTWRWLCRNQGLAYHDQPIRRAGVSRPGGTAVRVRKPADHGTSRLRYPRARFRPDEFGWSARVKTVPRVGRRELEDASEHVANSWRCVRVQVNQPRPGVCLLRGLRTDPLTVPFTEAEIPAEAFTPGGDLRKLRLYLGKDEWGVHRWLDVSNTPGVTIGGLPGFGKTQLIRLFLRQLEARRVPHRLAIVDGKGSADYDDLRSQCRIFTLDDLSDAAIALGLVQDGMRDRLGSILDLTDGYTNGWHVGPTEAMPLDITIIDEAHSFFALDAVKGDREGEKRVRQCVHSTSQVIKKGRSALQLVIVLTQKQTSDAVPTVIRDVAAIGISFACRTRDGAVASLGEQIRQYESYCPTTLNSPEYVGVCTTSLRTGADPFTRVRVPLLTPEAAWQRSRELAEVS